FKYVIDRFVEEYKDEGIEGIVAMDARGFIFGAPLAYQLGVPFILGRKPGKLPAACISASYALEYGTDSLEMHTDSISQGQKILIVDDLLATGGTMSAVIELVEKLGGEIAGIAFVVELTFIPGRQRLGDYPILSLVQY
ncbi:MAG: adenine phosphoribosyltransferase, partial [Anaerolineales bacterium]|nr:adenine phosphoribosyltransferase [Anaerolineales bacterium]